MHRLLVMGVLTGTIIAMSDHDEIDSDATHAMYLAHLRALIAGDVPGVEASPEHAEQIAKYLREQEAPLPLCIEDGVDADVIAYMKTVDALFETDEQGRVIGLGMCSASDTPSLNEILPRLAGLRNVREANISEDFHEQPQEFLTDDGFQAIAGWKELTCLDINVHSLTGRGFERLIPQNPLSRLTILRVSHLQNADLALKAIANCMTLGELSMSSCDLSEVGLSHLAKLTNLEDLDVSHTNVTGAGLKHLQHLKKLRKLQLEGTVVDDAGLGHLTGLQELEELWLGGPQIRITDAGLDHLAKLTRLREMSLKGSALTAEGIEKLASLPHLEYLALTNTSLGDEAIPTLSRLKHLRVLRMVGTRLTLKGKLQLRTALPKCDVQI